MQRIIKTYPFAAGQTNDIKQRMLNWSQQFSILLYLDSNNHIDKYSRYECLLAVGVHEIVDAFDNISTLAGYHQHKKDWLFGHISYDYKNQLEPILQSRNKTATEFQDIFFYNPQIVCYIKPDSNELTIETYIDKPDGIYNAVINTPSEKRTDIPNVSFSRRTEQKKYIDTVEQLRKHIKEGDCYEINYCNECYAEDVLIDEPVRVFNALNKLSYPPFAAFYRNEANYMMCASPERYLQKIGDKVLSQPIKGTAKRFDDTGKDTASKRALQNSVKDKAENVMITDLVRNDLARSCATGSIAVEELFGIYSFPQVHQMISTVTGKLDEDKNFSDTIKYSFPMGSMTGAPKIKVMELIDKYEDVSRNLYSGTVGYISPNGDFDFNVIIRSLFYNTASKYLSYQAGGAITYDSNAEGEWEEMLLKAWALEHIFA